MTDRNAKEEFLDVIKNDEIVCAKISRGRYKDDDDYKFIVLKKGHTKKDLDKFLTELDFIYDGGFGGQELFGIIWCKNGVWFDRYEYDGSECWDRHKYPKAFDVPPDLDRTN